MHTSRPRSGGFTIIEMLVVIGIIALLIGLLFPALSGVRQRGQKSAELNNIRQLTVAWFSYSQTYNDAALPGFLDIAVQRKNAPGAIGWGVRYEYPAEASNGSKLIPPAPMYGDSADPADNIAGPYPWRLAKYTDFAGHLFLGHTDEDDYFPSAQVARAEDIAYRPSFGYNAYYLGGWYEMHNVPAQGEAPPIDVPLTVFSDVLMRDDPAEPATRAGSVVARTLSNISQPQMMLVFCAGARRAPGSYRGDEVTPADIALSGQTGPIGVLPGSHYVTPRFLGEEPQWRSELGVLTAVADPAAVPVPRYGDTIATSFADGHVGSLTWDDLTDMRHWINSAGSANTTHTD